MNPLLVTFCLVAAAGLVNGYDIKTLTSASTLFSQRLYQEIALDKPLVSFSPLSLHMVLSMVSLGAREVTEKEMLEVLELKNLTGNTVHEVYKTLSEQLNAVTEVKLKTVNGLFLNPEKPIEPQFLKDASTYYNANVSHMELGAAEGPEEIINEYVVENTDGLIQDIIPKGTLNNKTIMVLVNTLLFNGTWEVPFPENQTQKSDFYKPDNSTVQVDMMYDERTLNIKKNIDNVDIAEIPFKGRRFSMYVLLPHEVDGITTLEKTIKIPGKMEEMLEGFTPTPVKLSLPKFKIESSFELKEALQRLGMKTVFDQNQVNLEGISSAGKVYISDAFHKTLLEVTEVGTVAAATSGVVTEIRSIREEPQESFKVDHSFMIILRDTVTKQILVWAKYSV